jgi:hypothetical protein
VSAWCALYPGTCAMTDCGAMCADSTSAPLKPSDWRFLEARPCGPSFTRSPSLLISPSAASVSSWASELNGLSEALRRRPHAPASVHYKMAHTWHTEPISRKNLAQPCASRSVISVLVVVGSGVRVPASALLVAPDSRVEQGSLRIRLRGHKRLVELRDTPWNRKWRTMGAQIDPPSGLVGAVQRLA